MDWNIVNECDNEDVPDYDYRTCDHNTYMCCWTENDGQGMADNTVRFRFPLWCSSRFVLIVRCQLF